METLSRRSGRGARADLNIMTLDQIIQVGNKVKVDYGPTNPNNQSLHIRAIVDDDQIVCRIWSARKGWIYQIISRYTFELQHAKGFLSLSK